MARRDLEELNLDLRRVRSRTDFLESYANTTGRELEDLPQPGASSAPSGGSTEGPDGRWGTNNGSSFDPKGGSVLGGIL